MSFIQGSEKYLDKHIVLYRKKLFDINPLRVTTQKCHTFRSRVWHFGSVSCVDFFHVRYIQRICSK